MTKTLNNLAPTGFVTSVGVAVPSQLTVTGSPITSAGVITLGLNAPTGTGNIVLGTAPTFNGLVTFNGDISFNNGPNTMDVSSGATSNWTLTLPTGTGTVGQVLSTDGSGTTSWVTGPGGSVTSVGLTVPMNQLAVTNSPIIGAGDIDLTLVTPTGTGSIVLENSPTLTGVVTATGVIALAGNLNMANGAFTMGIESAATSNYTLKLPVDGGLVGEVLTTDGTGTTTWASASGTVTSVAMSVPTGQLSIAGSPVETSGTLALTLNSPTGTGVIVLKDAPSFTGTVSMAGRYEVNVSGTDCARLMRTTSGDCAYFGTSLGGHTAMKIAFNGTTNSTSNSFDLGFFGGIQGTKFVATGDIEMTGTGGVGGKLLMKDTSNTNTLSITNQANTDWTMSLPQNGGTSGYVLSTDGSGVTSWVAQTGGGPGSGTVTSVGYAVGSGLSLSGTASPIIANGTFTISLDSPTGTGNVVLNTAPTISGAIEIATSSSLTMNSSPIYVKDDVNHGMVYDASPDGPSVFGFGGGNLVTNAVTSLTWGALGVTLPTGKDLIMFNGANATTIKSGAANNHILTLPPNLGSSGQVLTTDGAGITTWVTPLADPVPVANGGTGVTTSTGTTSVVLSVAPTLSGAVEIASSSSLTTNSSPIYVKDDTFHGIKYDATPNGPDVFGFGGGQLSYNGGVALTWDSNGIDIPGTVKGVANMESFYFDPVQSIPDNTPTTATNFVQESSTGTDLLSHSAGIVTNNLGYTVAVTFSYVAEINSFDGGVFRYWLHHSTQSVARYASSAASLGTYPQNGTHTFKLGNGENISLQVYQNTVVGAPKDLEGNGANNSVKMTRLSYVIHN